MTMLTAMPWPMLTSATVPRYFDTDASVSLMIATAFFLSLSWGSTRTIFKVNKSPAASRK
jgi:hypothetical protein